MEQKQGSMVWPILGGVGGVLLIASAFITWVTASLDFPKLVTALGGDPATVPAPQTVFHANGIKGWEGKVAIIAGVLAVVGFGIASKKVKEGARLMLIGGVAGAFAAIIAASIEKNAALNDAGAKFVALHIPGKISDYVSITLGIGLWLCLIAGILCIAAGVMAMKARAPEAAVAPPVMPGGGFGAPTQAPTATTPPPTATTPPPSATPPTPTSPPPPIPGAS